jgi:hypothetical protein
MRLAAVPIAATAIVIVVIVKEDAAPKPAMVAEIAMSSGHAEIVEVGPMANHVAAAAMSMAAAMTADKHKGAGSARRSLLLSGRSTGFSYGDRLCRCGIRQQGQAESCRCSCYNSFYEH